MLIVLSPAKTLDSAPAFPARMKLSKPQFQNEANVLARQLAAMSEKQLGKLMDISPKLAALNVARYAAFAPGEYPAAWMFRGDVYDGLDIDTLPAKTLPALEKRLRILSGLYGVLRPGDAMHPYRLEMGTALKTAKGKNLYAWWGERIAGALNDAAKEAKADVLLNLASIEYSDGIDRKALKPQWVDVSFKEKKGAKLQIVSFFAKKARGTMARWVIESGAQLKDLPKFKEDGYRYARDLSDDAHAVFIR